MVRLREDELELVWPLLVDLQLGEQRHYPDHPQFSRAEVERSTPGPQPRFEGRNVVFAERAPDGRALAGFCWCVLFDPGTGLEGEVAEVYVSPEHRGRGTATRLLRAAVRLFQESGVTLGYVWTREENAEATHLYAQAGFTPTRQLVMTWYPASAEPA